LSSTRSQSISTSTVIQEKVNENGNTYKEAVQDYLFKKREYKEESAGLQALVKQINKTVDPHHIRLYYKAEEEVKN
jgi:ribosomal protein S6